MLSRNDETDVHYSQLRPRLVSAFPPETLQFFYSNKTFVLLTDIIIGARTPETACFGANVQCMYVLYGTSASHNTFLEMRLLLKNNN